MVTLGKWPGDRYIEGDRFTQVSFELYWKLTNNFLCGSNHLIYILLTAITINSNTRNKASKISVVYF